MYYQRKFELFEGDTKKTWKIIKKLLEKKRGICDSFLNKLIINRVEITGTKTIAKNFL